MLFTYFFLARLNHTVLNCARQLKNSASKSLFGHGIMNRLALLLRVVMLREIELGLIRESRS